MNGRLLKIGRQDKLGYTRLKSELLSYRIELERAAERVEQSGGGDPPPWLDEAESLLQRADEALQNNEIEEGWSYLNAARRVELDSLATDDEDAVIGRQALGVKARVILEEAKDLSDPWVKNAITILIADKVGRLEKDENLSVAEVREARYLLDREHQQTHLKRRYVQEQFSGLILVGVVSLTLFVIVTLVGNYLVGSSISPFQAGARLQSWFIVYVLLAGTIGASLFGIVSSIKTDPRVQSLPQTISSGWMVVGRVLLGAISAFVLFLFIRSDIVNLSGNSEALILLIALAAGYSERFAPKALDALSEQLGSKIERDEEILARLERLAGELEKRGATTKDSSEQADGTSARTEGGSPSSVESHDANTGSIPDSDQTGDSTNKQDGSEQGSDPSKSG